MHRSCSFTHFIPFSGTRNQPWEEVAPQSAQSCEEATPAELYHHPWTTTIEAPRAYLAGRMPIKKEPDLQMLSWK